jgi:3-deoxy-D-manno-octulosonate 8-phosphate phosphatase (KDO 8-P phosphatase)
MPTRTATKKRLSNRRRLSAAAAKAARIRLLLFDVDGVLTDGKILLHGDGSESKLFDIRDGTGIVWAHRAGLTTGLLSGRESAATTARATQLGIPIVHQSASSKLDVYQRILAEQGLKDSAVAFMGDDVLDLPVLIRAGLSAAPSNAAPEVLARADWTSRSRGGDGAVREFIEFVLRAQRKWEPLVRDYSSKSEK